MTILIQTAAFFLLCGLGLSILRWFERSEEKEGPAQRGERDRAGRDGTGRDTGMPSALERLAWGFLCGVAATGLAGQTSIWIGLRLTPAWWGGFGAVALALVILTLILDFKGLVNRWRGFLARPAGILPRSPMGWALMILTFAALAWSFREAVGLPVTAWDPVSFWYLKTKILLREGTVFCPDFLDPDRLHAHTDYPLLVNIVEAGICRAIGEYRETPLRVFLAAWELACLVIAGGAMARRRGNGAGWGAAALIALFPALLDPDTTGAVSGYRDAPLALAILAAACASLDWIEGKRFHRGDAARLVLLLVLVLGTKREGTVWALLLGLATVGAMLRMGAGRTTQGRTPMTSRTGGSGETSRAEGIGENSRAAAPSGATALPASPWRGVVLGGMIALVIPFGLMLPWFIVRSEMPYPRSEEFTKTMKDQRWDVTGQRETAILGALSEELFLRVQKWGVLWWVFAAVGVWRWRAWSPRERLFALLVPAGWGMAAAGFVFTPWDDPLAHLAVSVDRLVLQGAFLALWLTTLNVTARPGAACTVHLADCPQPSKTVH